MNIWSPWNFFPGLTEDRLRTVAWIIQEARRDAMTTYDPDRDNNWCIGCRAYTWTTQAIEAATNRYPEWLRVLDNRGNRFLFSVADAPMKFYRGAPEQPTANTLRQTYPELDQKNFLVEAMGQRLFEDCILRLAVETDESGEASAVTLVYISPDASQMPLAKWPIPMTRLGTKIVSLDDRRKKGKDLGPPPVGSKDRRAKNEDEDEE